MSVCLNDQVLMFFHILQVHDEAGLYLEEATSLNVDTDAMLIHENIAKVYGGGIYSKSPLILPPSPEKYTTNEIAKPVTSGKGPDIYVDGSVSFTFG